MNTSKTRTAYEQTYRMLRIQNETSHSFHVCTSMTPDGVRKVIDNLRTQYPQAVKAANQTFAVQCSGLYPVFEAPFYV